ncbi:hypothetical protein LUZ61_003322 [Rhynchospora tenuis]|uniref:Acid phosphatase n=1 Tax=Rhynchospora tenuis TaxID=198213 RepID=A0AAD5ZKK0_9POAL|nr:hypothetical protein LUZ61_003322 [Rhynchospora tenuis]
MHAMPPCSSLGDNKINTSKSHLSKALSFIVSPILKMWKFFLLLLTNLFAKTALAYKTGPFFPNTLFDSSYCLSWRVAVETNNAGPWATVPIECVLYVGRYMLGGQYNRDLETVMEMIGAYLDGMEAGDDDMDAWVLDIDDTCLSNLLYYQGKQFGGMPFDPAAFKSWAGKGMCSAILPVLDLFNKLIERGYKVFLLTGRDDLTFRDITTANLHNQGFVGYERLIMRTADYKGKGAKFFKSAMRKQLMDEGYRLRGNVGDQWSDLQGDYLADRNFKIPNPMYYVP